MGSFFSGRSKGSHLVSVDSDNVDDSPDQPSDAQRSTHDAHGAGRNNDTQLIEIVATLKEFQKNSQEMEQNILKKLNELNEELKREITKSRAESQELATEKEKHNTLVDEHASDKERLNDENSSLKLQLTSQKEKRQNHIHSIGKLKLKQDALSQKNQELLSTQQAQTKAEADMKDYYDEKHAKLVDEHAKGIKMLNDENATLKSHLADQKGQLKLKQGALSQMTQELLSTQQAKPKAEADMKHYHEDKLQKIENERKEAERNEIQNVSCLVLHEPGIAQHFQGARDDFMKRLSTQLKEQKKDLQLFHIPPSGDLPRDADNLQKPHVLIMPCLAVSRVSSSIDSLMSKPAAKAGHTMLFVVFHPRAPHDKTVAPTVKQVGSLPPGCVQLVDVVFNRTNGAIFERGLNDTAVSAIADYINMRPTEHN